VSAWNVVEGDARKLLPTLPDGNFHACVTSPPYFGLRNYSSGDGEIGLEETPAEYVVALVEVFREIRRVLHPSGTLWVVIGDTYAGGGGGNYGTNEVWRTHGQHIEGVRNKSSWLARAGVKAKDLIGIPYMLAFALRDDGWWWRQNIVWAKVNALPESVSDRCTRAHETILVFSKREHYFYDQDAIREPCTDESIARTARKWDGERARDFPGAPQTLDISKMCHPAGRNKRNVWFMATETRNDGTHHAVYPEHLVEPMMLSATSEGGCCSSCGAPWKRVPEQEDSLQVEWKPTCGCGGEPVPCRVIDPFSGSGTTGVVAARLGRSYLGIELNNEYVRDSTSRIVKVLSELGQLSSEEAEKRGMVKVQLGLLGLD